MRDLGGVYQIKVLSGQIISGQVLSRSCLEEEGGEWSTSREKVPQPRAPLPTPARSGLGDGKGDRDGAGTKLSAPTPNSQLGKR